jgi:isocitrate lyase
MNLRTNFENGTPMSCYGALDNVQMINATKYQPCIYVSGW